MLRWHPGRSGAGRLALFALVPIVLAGGLWLVTRDGGSPATTRLEATQSSIDPLLAGQALVGPWDAAGPATPATQPAPAASGATDPGATESAAAAPGPVADAAPAPASGAAIGRADSVDGGVDGGAGATSEPEPTSPRGTGAATSTAELSGGATSEPSAPSAGEGTTTTEPTTTSTPTTQATTTTTAAPAPVPAPSAGRSRHGAAEAEVVPLTNQDRTAAGLGTLSRNSCLDSAASGFAEQMARSGVMAHNSGAGAAVRGCWPGAAWGDNVGTAKPCDTALLEKEWMDSPSHRRNILTGEFTLIGVGAWTDDKGACWVQVLFSS